MQEADAATAQSMTTMFHSQAIDFQKNTAVGVFFTNSRFHRDVIAGNARGASSCTGLSTASVDKPKLLLRRQLAPESLMR
jgi:hypothetical protein